MSNDALLKELRTRVLRLKSKASSSHMEAAMQELLDEIEEGWTEGLTEPCGLQEREHYEDIPQEVYAALIVWEYCVEVTNSIGQSWPHDTKEEVKDRDNLGCVLSRAQDECGVNEMRRWAGLVGGELDRAYEDACRAGTPRAGDLCVAFDYEWIPSVLTDYAREHDDLLPATEAYQYGKRHYITTMKRAKKDMEENA